MGFPSRILPNHLSRHRLTHALRIHLATSKTYAELQSSLGRLRDDDLTRALPYPVWESLNCLCIHIGSLSLFDQHRFTTAKKTLKDFDVSSSLGD